MIIDKIKLTEEEQRERAELNKQYANAIKGFKDILPDTESGQLTFELFMKQDGVSDALDKMNSIGSMLELQRMEAEARHMKELGTSEAILAEAKEVIQALEKKDFQDFIRLAKKAINKPQTEEMKRDKAFQASLKKYSYTFESAYRYILSQVKPYHRALKDLGEETEIIDHGKRLNLTYLDLLEVEALRKAYGDFGYTPKSERKKRGQKQTVSLKEELTAVEGIEEADLYNKSISDRVTRSVEMSIGKKPEKNKITQDLKIVTNHGQLMWIMEDNDEELMGQVDQKSVTAESYFVVNMLLEKLLKQIPELKLFKGKMTPAKQRELDKITETLKDEKSRTVSLTLGEYMGRRKSKGRKATIKENIVYALRSIGAIEAKFGGKEYYMFSSKPQEMYKAGNIEAVFNLDWCRHLYTEESKIVRFPEVLYTVDLHKHPHVVLLWAWLRQNYEANTSKQNPHTNRVQVSTTIDRIPALKERFEDDKKSGQSRYWDRVFQPLLSSLEALNKTYGLLDYELLDKNKKKITASKFNRMNTEERLQCWIRYELTGYPRWKAPEQLTGKAKKKEDSKKK